MSRVSDRDRLERDENGTRRQDQNRGGGRGGNGGGGKKGLAKRVLILAVCGIVGIWILGTFNLSDFQSLFRTWNSTNTQGVVQIFNAVEGLEEENRKIGEELDEGENRGLHDRDRIYNDVYMTEMIPKEYLVYVFTGDAEIDKDFDEWVANNEKNIQIFRIDRKDLDTNKEVLSYTDVNGKKEPLVLVYNEVERGKKVLEGVIKDAKLLDETKEYINNLIEEKMED